MAALRVIGAALALALAVPAGARPGHLRAYDRDGERLESARVP